MPVNVFCERCRDFTPLEIEKTVNLEKGIDVNKFYCENCNGTWWEIDDYQTEILLSEGKLTE